MSAVSAVKVLRGSLPQAVATAEFVHPAARLMPRVIRELSSPTITIGSKFQKSHRYVRLKKLL